jgi:hypothetical protein
VRHRYALSAGVAINLDNFQELQRTAEMINTTPGLLSPGSTRQQLVGLRINPQVHNLPTVPRCPVPRDTAAQGGVLDIKHRFSNMEWCSY